MGEMNVDSIAKAMSAVETGAGRVVRVEMNGYTYARLRRNGRDYLDIETRASLFAVGVVGSIFGAQIQLNMTLPQHHFTLLAEDGSEWTSCLEADATGKSLCERADCIAREVHDS